MPRGFCSICRASVVLPAENSGTVRTVLVEPVERELRRGALGSPCPEAAAGAPGTAVPGRSFVQCSNEIPLRWRWTSRLVASIVSGVSRRLAGRCGLLRVMDDVRRVTADNVVMDGGVDLRRVRYLMPVRSPGSGRALVECFHGLGHRGNLGHQGTRPPAMGNNGSGYYRAQQPDKRAEDLPPC